MVQPEKDWDMDVAASLREIAANSDKITGKILKQSQKAASKGLSYIQFKISDEDYNFLQRKTLGKKAPPYVERLESLGFKLDYTSEETWWSIFKQGIDYNFDRNYNHYIIVRW